MPCEQALSTSGEITSGSSQDLHKINEHLAPCQYIRVIKGPHRLKVIIGGVTKTESGCLHSFQERMMSGGCSVEYKPLQYNCTHRGRVPGAGRHAH